MECSPLWNTEASAGNCGSRGELHLLGGYLKRQESKIYLWNFSWHKKGWGPQFAARKSQVRGKENTTRRWVVQHWNRSCEALKAQPGKPPKLLLGLTSSTVRNSPALSNLPSPSQLTFPWCKGCGNTRFLWEISASKSKWSGEKKRPGSVGCRVLSWDRSQALSHWQKSSLSSVEWEATHPWGSRNKKPMFLSPVAQKGWATGAKSLHPGARQHGLINSRTRILSNPPESWCPIYCRRPLLQKTHLDFFILCLPAEMEED